MKGWGWVCLMRAIEVAPGGEVGGPGGLGGGAVRGRVRELKLGG